MKHFIKVRGSQETVPTLEVNIDTVYVRSNISRIETEEFTGWEYDEIQYGIREYIEVVSTKTIATEEYLLDIDYRMTMKETGV